MGVRSWYGGVGLGTHTTGAACVYVNKLDDLDNDVLRELIRLGYEHMSTTGRSYVER